MVIIHLEKKLDNDIELTVTWKINAPFYFLRHQLAVPGNMTL